MSSALHPPKTAPQSAVVGVYSDIQESLICLLAQLGIARDPPDGGGDAISCPSAEILAQIRGQAINVPLECCAKHVQLVEKLVFHMNKVRFLLLIAKICNNTG